MVVSLLCTYGTLGKRGSSGRASPGWRAGWRAGGLAERARRAPVDSWLTEGVIATFLSTVDC